MSERTLILLVMLWIEKYILRICEYLDETWRAIDLMMYVVQETDEWAVPGYAIAPKV